MGEIERKKERDGVSKRERENVCVCEKERLYKITDCAIKKRERGGGG